MPDTGHEYFRVPEEERPRHYVTHPLPWGYAGLERIMTRDEAFELLLTVNGRTPADWVSWMNYGVALHVSGNAHGALKAARRAMELYPCSSTLMNVAVILESFGEFDEALELSGHAVEMDPTNQFAGLLWAQGHLRRGRWAESWRAFEHYCWGRIWEVGLEQYVPQWQGEPLDGKRLLVMQGGGFGDNLMFMRWFRDIKEMGAHITYACPEVMEPLLCGHPWIDALLPTHEGPETGDLPELTESLGQFKLDHLNAAQQGKFLEAYNAGMSIKALCRLFRTEFVCSYDYFVPLMGIPRRLNASVKSVEAHPEPYITPRPDSNWHFIPKENRTRPFVGVCWMGAEKLDPRRHRSLNPAQCKSLLEAGLNKVSWVSLQYGLDAPVLIAKPNIKNWNDTALIVQSLDLIITVDTGVMHLAGAMGKKCWALIPGLSDWKFLLGRDDMVFYPSVRLFRNKGEGLDNALCSVIESIQNL